MIRLLRVIYDEQDLGRAPDSHSIEVDAAEFSAESLSRPNSTQQRGGQGFGLTTEQKRAETGSTIVFAIFVLAAERLARRANDQQV